MKTLEHTSSIPSLEKSTPEEYDLVILGGGTGSTIAAWTFAGQGMRVAVIERKYIGGSCPNIACLPSKNIIHSAKLASYFRRSDEFGITREPFTVDMTAVRNRKRSMVSSLNDVYLENYRQTGAELILGSGRFVGPRTVEATLADGTTRKLRGTKNAGLPYTALRDTILVHPTLVEGLIPLFSSTPSQPKSSKSAPAVQGALSAH